jgi:tetratricopeptide (TPR) repeat protein
MKLVAIITLVASCYAPATIRREQTTLAPDATQIMAAALAPPESKQQRFDQHYQAAIAFYNERKYPEAIAEFEAAYEVDPQPLIVFNIGQAYRKGGLLDEALVKYREYLDKDPAAERDRVNDIIKDVEHSIAMRKTTTVQPIK